MRTDRPSPRRRLVLTAVLLGAAAILLWNQLSFVRGVFGTPPVVLAATLGVPAVAAAAAAVVARLRRASAADSVAAAAITFAIALVVVWVVAAAAAAYLVWQLSHSPPFEF